MKRGRKRAPWTLGDGRRAVTCSRRATETCTLLPPSRGPRVKAGPTNLLGSEAICVGPETPSSNQNCQILN